MAIPGADDFTPVCGAAIRIVMLKDPIFEQQLVGPSEMEPPSTCTIAYEEAEAYLSGRFRGVVNNGGVCCGGGMKKRKQDRKRGNYK